MEISLMQYVTLFIIYSFLGWILESTYRSICEKKLINTGFLYGPFCPIYGVGAIIMLLFLENFKSNIIILFIAGFIILSIWEYIVGWLLEKVFNTTYWDYSDHKINIKGRICLTNSIFWGVLGIIFIYFVHPFVMELLNKTSDNIITVSTVILGGYIAIDAIVTIVKVKRIEGQIDKLKQIGENIKEKLEELKNIKVIQHNINIEKIQEKIDELKYQETKIRRKLIKKTNRLKKAFPTMKSKAISEFLSDKIEIIKEKTKK